ncbi:MAG: nucleoside-diphosphate kinase [Candidatus Zambryskibacteria bacterium]|nr:nucleoside-diphosphate kinase [Candidatus Zambryskibacteria bacterium]
MNNHPSKERTLVIIKPDGVQRSLIGEIIKRYEKMGLKMIAIKMVVPDASFVRKHYTVDPEWQKKAGEKAIASYQKKGIEPPLKNPIEAGNRVLETLIKYMTSGPVVALVWQGAHAVEVVRKVTGGTEPRTSDVGTIRGDFVLDSYIVSDTDGRAVRNLIHASGSTEEANKEIKLWFKENELVNYRLIAEQILYDVNLDGILE